MLPIIFIPCSPCLPWRFPQQTLVSAQDLSLPVLWALLSSYAQEGYLPGLPFRFKVRSELELPLQKCQALRPVRPQLFSSTQKSSFFPAPISFPS